ncbi:uncharacterized protein LOC122070258 [Macadamia integrifolia]|uniref:uncharacterized protein LOC122070258 n=1 Tax=Macadamia integrifolia TaxID=60698 RepID=UPI001C4F3B8E|nr:uncharacterized protein LOC122070258 [Macadamia integrifolia]
MALLHGSNFNDWHEELIYYLAAMDYDYALRNEKPGALTDESIDDEVTLYDWWERSNHLYLLSIMKTITKTIKSSIPTFENAKEYLSNVENRFTTTEKSLAGTLMTKVVTMKYTSTNGVGDHISKMAITCAQLKPLELGFLTTRKPNQSKSVTYMGNRQESEV